MRSVGRLPQRDEVDGDIPNRPQMSESSPSGKSSVRSSRLKAVFGVAIAEVAAVSPVTLSLGHEMVAELRKI